MWPVQLQAGEKEVEGSAHPVSGSALHLDDQPPTSTSDLPNITRVPLYLEEDFNLLQGVALVVVTTSFHCAGYILVQTWYNTLPPVDLYGGLLKMHLLFVKHPKLIYRFAKVMIYTAVVYPVIFLMLLPLVLHDQRHIYYSLQAFIWVKVGYLLLFGVLQHLVARMVIKMFKRTLESLGREMNESATYVRRHRNSLVHQRKYNYIAKQHARVFGAIKTANLSTTFMILAILSSVLLCSLLAANELRYQYLLVNIELAMSYLGAAVIVLLMAKRTVSRVGLFLFISIDHMFLRMEDSFREPQESAAILLEVMGSSPSCTAQIGSCQSSTAEGLEEVINSIEALLKVPWQLQTTTWLR